MTLQEALKYSTNRTHSDFVDAALAQPESEVHPLVYADWLQEQGQEGLAEHIRKSVEQHKLKGVKNLTTKLTFPLGDNPVALPSIGLSLGRGGKDIHLHSSHPSASKDTTAHFGSTHTDPKEVKRLLESMQGVSGQEFALQSLISRLG